MKKVFLAVAFLATTVGFAQEFSIGAKAGLNLSSLSGIEGSKMATGFHAGAIAELKLTDMISLQPELMYSMQGGDAMKTLDLIAVKSDFETQVRSSYINLPVMGKFYVAEGFSLEFGPQVGFLMSSKADIESKVSTKILGGIKTNIPTERDLKASSNTIDFGLNAGLGYKLDNGLYFSARYNFGLTPTIKENITINTVDPIPPYTVVSADNGKNSVIQVSIGYFFN